MKKKIMKKNAKIILFTVCMITAGYNAYSAQKDTNSIISENAEALSAASTKGYSIKRQENCIVDGGTISYDEITTCMSGSSSCTAGKVHVVNTIIAHK